MVMVMEDQIQNGRNRNGNEHTLIPIPVPIPIGFRFRPTDEEVVVHYLRPKSMSLPFPTSVIPEFLPIFHSDPWSLPGDTKEKKYYFAKRKGDVSKFAHKCSKMMTTTSGFWKPIGKGKNVISTLGKNDVAGCRKSWAFYQIHMDPTHAHGLWSKTRWFMHEFQLLPSTSQNQVESDNNWVICRVFQRKIRKKYGGFPARVHHKNNNNNFVKEDKLNIIDFRMENSLDMGPPEPSSPSQDESTISC